MANYTEESRNKDFEYFVEHYHDLYETYGHKFLAIRDETVIGHFDSVLDAINSLSDKYEIGSYIIQECTGEESAYRTVILGWRVNNYNNTMTQRHCTELM